MTKIDDAERALFRQQYKSGSQDFTGYVTLAVA